MTSVDEASLLLVEPRPRCLAWLAERGRAERRFPEEDGAFLIPRRGSFKGADAFDAYLSELKPRLLRAELGRFGLEVTDLPRELSCDAVGFDALFELRLRDVVSDLRGPEPNQ